MTVTSASAGEALLARVLALPPFPWQARLLAHFATGDVPAALDLPTGLGKTAVMAIWLVARALGARLPRRLVYVVDRRAVVDQATDLAMDLQRRVGAAADLREALGLSRPLPISTLRGQFADNKEWLADPSVPSIVVGTVDMIGSRLLFGGYGVSRRMQPYHAGLLGADALIVLDEAHLVPPFERLIEAIERGTAADGSVPRLGACGKHAAIVPRLRLLSLSATGRDRGHAFRLDRADTGNPIVRRRLDAKKRLVVRDAVESKDLAARLVFEAWALAGDGQTPVRCIVFVNSRDVAQQVRDQIAARGADVQLFVGARRVFERQQAAQWLRDRGFLAGSEARAAKATFLVATSAGEVGVDLDADHMAADLVAWERMVQRLGRVNRRGGGEASVVIVPDAGAGNIEQMNAVRNVIAELPELEHDARDASPCAIVALKERAVGTDLAVRIERASTPAPLHPPLTRPLVEAWSMTSLEEHTGRPEVAPWIRGWIDEEEPQATVLFREHLPVDVHSQMLPLTDVEMYLDVAAPHFVEKLETEAWRVVDWLDTRRKRLLATNKKLDDTTQPGDDGTASSSPRAWLARDPVVAVLVNGARSDTPRPVKLTDVATPDGRKFLKADLGDATLIVDVRIGGLVDGLLDADADAATGVPDSAEVNGGIPFRIRPGEANEEDPGASGWREEARLVTDWFDGEACSWLVVESAPGSYAESEEGRSVTASRAQLLDEHQTWTEQRAQRLANRLGIPEPLAGVLALAARLHDEGKRATNWQRAFGVTDAELAKGLVYGKTTSHPRRALLARYRHELGSIPRAEADPRVRALPPELRDLCLHLIAAHHGYARPILRTDGAEGPPSALAERARDIALRFWRLEKQWGPWGLAWWEALLRAADQQASRDNDEGERRG